MNTETIQNTIKRIHGEVELGVLEPSTPLKRQFFKACQVLDSARHEFDILNDLKAALGKEVT